MLEYVFFSKTDKLLVSFTFYGYNKSKYAKKELSNESAPFFSARALLQWFPLLAVASIVLIAIHYRSWFSLDYLSARMPAQPLAAAGLILLLFALKSLSIVFPILVLYALSGILSPPVPALLLNLLGTAVVVSLPYGLGRLSGTELVNHIFAKYKKAARLRDFQQQNGWFLAYFLRVLGILPGDVVSMYLGASKLPFPRNLLGGLAGMLPSLLAATFLGSSITDPASPVFLASAGGMVLISLLSAVVYRILSKRHPNGSEKKDPPD